MTMFNESRAASDNVLPLTAGSVAGKGEQATAAEPFVKDQLSGTDQIGYVRELIPTGIQTIASSDQARNYWSAVEQEVNTHGREPLSAMLAALERSRVLGIGETHEEQGNSLRKWGLQSMQRLHDRGKVTHLAVEVPSSLRPIFDRFNLGKDDLLVPQQLTRADGSIDASPAAQGALKFLRALPAAIPDLYQMWKAARDAGINVVPVDHPRAQEKSGCDLSLFAERDKHISEQVLQLIDGDDRTRVTVWLGANHLVDYRGSKRQPATFCAYIPEESAVEWLRAGLRARGQGDNAVTTFGSQIGNGQSHDLFSLYPLSGQLARPVAVPTHQADRRENALGNLPVAVHPEPDFAHRWSAFDQVLVFPRNRWETMQDQMGKALRAAGDRAKSER